MWLEWQDKSEASLPVHNKPNHTVTWLERVDKGQRLREAAESLDVPEGAFAWVACDWGTTRAITKSLKAHGVPKTAIKAQAYWK